MQASGFIEAQICHLFRCNYSCNFQKGDTVCSHKQNGLHPGRGQEISCFSQISKQSAQPERTPHSCGTKYHICGKTAVCQNTFWRRNKSSISMLREDTDFREKKKKLKPQTSVGKMSGNNVLTGSRIICKILYQIFCCLSCWSLYLSLNYPIRFFLYPLNRRLKHSENQNPLQSNVNEVVKVLRSEYV